MNAQTMPRLWSLLLAPAAAARAAIAGRMRRLSASIDAQAPPLHRRMGAWEAGVSVLAREALDAARGNHEDRN